MAVFLLSASAAHAQDGALPLPPPPPPAPVADKPAASDDKRPGDAKPAAEPYVSPFQLRGVNPGTQVRLDTTVAPFHDPTTNTNAVGTVSLFSASGRLSKYFALNARLGVVRSDVPRPDDKGASTGFTNMTGGAMFGTTMGRHWRFAASTGFSLPTASGGGNDGDAAMAAAMKAGQYARALMDNGMFTINDLGFPMGVDVAYTRSGFTAQAELTVIPSARVRGEEKQADKSKVNSTAAVFFGYYVIPRLLSVGSEVHYQRFLSTPESVAKDESMRSNLSVSGGVRTYFTLASNVTFRPGLSVGTGLAGAIADRGYQMVQVDLPVAF